MRKVQEFYRGHYLIGIYEHDKYEQCVAVLDNLHQFAMYYGLEIYKATIILNRIWHNINHCVTYRGKCYKVYFIDNND